MCGIAGVCLRRPATATDAEGVAAMARLIDHRGPDEHRVASSGSFVLAAERLAIMDVTNGQQPYYSEDNRLLAVFNGEIYNHRELRANLTARGHRFASHSDGEVIVHLYEEYGTGFVERLDGQFAIALADVAADVLLLARDRFGICPLYWAQTSAGLYFCSEAKGLLEAGAGQRQLDPGALLQLSYFGTVCAPRTAFSGIQSLPPGHWMQVGADSTPVPRRYWSLTFPTASEQRPVTTVQAVAGIQDRLEEAVEACTQGEFPATSFLSGGLDSATISALLARRAGPRGVQAFCAASDNRRISEGNDAQATATALGLRLEETCITEPDIAAVFPRLIWHGETPVTSTEAAALFLLAGQVRENSKIVLTGEGADEAFGGYLAFRQAKPLRPLLWPGMTSIRALARNQLTRYYGSDCLLPADRRIAAIRSHLGCFPAQAIEWEFYGATAMRVLAQPYREMLAAGQQWDAFDLDHEAVRGRHWLNQSLYVGYQVMLPNYLLGPHGDRVFAGNSVEGRYPFLDRRVVEYAAALPPALKIRYRQEKYVLRQAVRKWLPDELARRPKTRFIMPFGTPFIDPGAPEIYSHLLSPRILREYGYFEPTAVQQVVSALHQKPSGSGARAYLERLWLGIALTLVCSTQLWHYMYVTGAEVPQPSAPAGNEKLGLMT